jgi:hypothetical protein
MLAGDRALLGHHFPAIGGLVQLQHPVVLDDRGTAFLGSTGIGMHRAGGVEIAFAVGPHRPEMPSVDMIGQSFCRFLGAHQAQSSMPMD